MRAKNNGCKLLICSLATSCDTRPAEISDSVNKMLEGEKNLQEFDKNKKGIKQDGTCLCPELDYFPVTEYPEVFCSFSNTGICKRLHVLNSS